MSGAPHPKSAQLKRGPKRGKRFKADSLEWAAIRAVKFGPCRVRALGGCEGRIELHHLLPRAHGGDDCSANVAPLCTKHHKNVTSPAVKAELARNLTDAEYAYIVDKLGEGGIEWLFGVFRFEPVFACRPDESAGLAS